MTDVEDEEHEGKNQYYNHQQSKELFQATTTDRKVAVRKRRGGQFEIP